MRLPGLAVAVRVERPLPAHCKVRNGSKALIRFVGQRQFARTFVPLGGPELCTFKGIPRDGYVATYVRCAPETDHSRRENFCRRTSGVGRQPRFPTVADSRRRKAGLFPRRAADRRRRELTLSAYSVEKLLKTWSTRFCWGSKPSPERVAFNRGHSMRSNFAAVRAPLRQTSFSTE